MEFSFFITDNKSGYKTKEVWFSKNHPEVYDEIINYSSKIDLNLSFKEKIWFYFNQLSERPKCVTCSKELKFRERFDNPYGEFCSLICINTNKDEMLKRQKSTFNEKYGIDFYPQHQDFVKKQKQTKLERYGDENFVNAEKMLKTKLLKYGRENISNSKKYKETCIKKYGIDNFAKTTEFKNKIHQKYRDLYPNYNIINIDGTQLTVFCEKCGDNYEIHKQVFYERIRDNNIVCTNCNKLGQCFISSKEQEINDFVRSLNIETIQTFKTKDKTEIDIFIPSKNLGIELNGVYWHNELFKDKNFHLSKTKSAENDGIELLHIFEDEWNGKKEIVKSIIKNRLGLVNEKIYARKCHIKELTAKAASDFLNENHIQGEAKSLIKLGLFNGEKLVSVMTFSKGRIIMSGKNDEWELVRFCNILNTNVIGAGSKLLNFFMKNYNPKKIVSYSDIRLFNGSLYEKIGFTRISQSPPSYWYVINGIRHYRFNFRKSILIKEGFDSNKTEHQIMLDRGIYRIYDCGAIRWELNY